MPIQTFLDALRDIKRRFKDRFKLYDHSPIVMSYAKGFFDPSTQAKSFTSAGQIAQRVHEVLSEFGSVLYDDFPKKRRTELLFTIDNHTRCQTVVAKRTILFPAVAHLRFTREILLAHKALTGSHDVERLDSENDVASFEQGLRKASLILIIGNERILDTYIRNGVPRSKLALLDYGVDESVFLRSAPPDTKLTFVYPASTLCLRKGFPFLVKSWNRFVETVPQDSVNLIVMGASGDCSSYMQELKSAEYLGEYKAGSATYVNALNRGHFVIFPSLSEGQAGTVLEAMSCGCLPIATLESGITPTEFGGRVAQAGCSDSLFEQLVMTHQGFSLAGWKKQSEFCVGQVREKHNWPRFKSELRRIVSALLKTNG